MLLDSKKSEKRASMEKKLTLKMVLIAVGFSVSVMAIGLALFWFFIIAPEQQFESRLGFNVVEDLIFESSDYYQPPPSFLMNEDRQNFVFDKDTLTYLVVLYGTNRSASITIEPEYQLFVGNENVTSKIHVPHILHLNSTHNSDYIFFTFSAHEGGINVLKVDLPVYNKQGKQLENKTQTTKYDIASLGIKLQDDSNKINSGLLIATIFVGAGTVIALSSNVIFSSRQVKTSALLKVFDLLSTPEVRKAREIIHKEYCRQKKENQTISFKNTEEIQDLEEKVDLVLSSLHQASVIVTKGLLDEETFFDAYGQMIVRDWKTLQSEILKRMQDNPEILKHFTELKEKFEKRPDIGDTEPYCKKQSKIRGTLPKGF